MVPASLLLFWGGSGGGSAGNRRRRVILCGRCDMVIARQSTARTVTVGPVLDADGVAVTDGVVADFKISKNGGAPAALNGSATLTHRATGHYSLALTATDLDTVGQAEIVIDDTTNACPAKELTVVEEAVYDAMFAASAAGYQIPIWSGPTDTVSLTNTTVATVTTTGTATAVTTVNGLAANVITAASLAADAGAEIADAVWDEDATGHQTQGTFGQAIGDPAADASTIYGAVVTGAAGATIAADIIAVKAETAAILDDTDLIDDGTSGLAKIATDVAAILVDTGTTLQGELDGIQADTEDIQTRLPAALVGGRMDATVDATGMESGATAAIATAVWDSGNIDGYTHSGALSVVYSNAARLAAGLTLAAGTIGGTGNSTTALHLAGLTHGDDELNDCLLVIHDVSEGEYHARWISDWTATGDIATVATLPFTPQDSTDTYVILAVRQDVTGGSGLDAAGVRAAVGLASANLDTQLSAIDTVVDDILVDTAVIGAAGAGLTEAGGTGDHLTAVPWNAAWDAEVQSEVQDALVANNLDHLVLSAVDTDFATTVHANSVIGHLADNGAGFDRTTDSLEAIRDRGDSAWATATGFSTLDAAGVRAAVGLASSNLDTQLGDLPTNAELATALAGADDAVLAAVAALNNVSAAQVNAEVDTALADVGMTTTVTGRIDAAVSSRMATYAQPTGFLAATFPLTVASTTNITAGTITTVTNLTNLPAITTDWVTAAGISSGAANKLADHSRRRTQANVEASSDGDTLSLGSQYGAIQMMQEASASGTVLTVYRTDGSTSLGTKTLTTDDAAEPVTAIS